ncbi:hypothetical protein HY486_02430 [Candidatus Woesearchaeota archaeon]|nr:hypothetical protein [Candidatus Woesearchaeota archaeon]
MKRIALLGLFVFLLIIVGCARQPPEQVPFNNSTIAPTTVINVSEVVQKNPCEGISCNKNEICKEGKCFCAPDFRQCGNECIPVAQCCDNSNCKPQESCVNGNCEKTDFCPFMMEYNPEKKTCSCVQATRFCFDQQRCISTENCCDVADCNPLGGDERGCISTKYRADICVKFNGGSHCKKAVMGERTSFSFGTDYYDIFVDNLYENGVANIRAEKAGFLSNFSYVKKSGVVSIGNLSIENRNADMIGGNCKSS